MAVGLLVLAACAAPPAAVPTVDALARLRTGEPLLTCRERCLEDWRRTQPQAAQLAASARWADLATLVLRIGYQDDLSLYYLAAAAEGLGYQAAAASYYRQSTYLSGTAISCQNLSRLCGGLDLPRVALRRLAVLERGFDRRRPRRGASAPRETETSTPPATMPASPPEPITTSPSEQPSVAFPPAAQVPPPPPNPPPETATPAAPSPPPARSPSSDYIEPPPAAR